jgi:hypothetical protein
LGSCSLMLVLLVFPLTVPALLFEPISVCLCE